MRAGLSTIQQTLTPEAASVLNHSIAEASRRNHGQTTPLHVAATLLASPTGFLRQACIKSHPNSSHPLQCRALELCFSVALERLPTAQNSGPGIDPPISNALMAALKRAQAHQRRGCPEQQQQPLLAVKVELEQLIISILDDPSVSRVMREASFSSPAVKATIEQSLNSTSTNSSISGPIGLGFRPVQAAGPSPNRNPYLNPRLQQSAAAAQQSGQPRGEVVQKVIDILLGGRRKNVVLVGASEPERVVKEVLWKIESKEIGDGSLRNVEVIRLNIEPGSDKDQIVAKIKELGALVETRIGKLESGGVILDLGDLKWLVGQQAGFGAVGGLPPQQQQVVPEGGRAAVAEMARLLARFGDGVGGRVWLIGTATCETYLRCQIHHPSMENDWDLQAVPIASRTPLQGLFPRIGQNGLLGSSAESMPSLRGLSMTSGQQRCLTDSFDQSKKASGLCPQCLQNYEQELARMEAFKELEKSSDKLESAKSALPQWLQTAKVQDSSAKSTDQLKDEVWKQKSLALQKKWNDMCLHLHPRFHQTNLGSERFASNALSMTSLCAPNMITSQTLQQPRLQQCRSVADTIPMNPKLMNPILMSSRPTERANTPPGSPVRTDLVLGRPKLTVPEPTPKEIVRDFFSSGPQKKLQELPTGKLLDAADSFKKFLKSLVEKVWWQHDAASAVATTVAQCRLGNGRRRAAGSKGDIWLLFMGPDRAGKKKMASALSELVCGAHPVSINLGTRRNDEEPDPGVRGKTVVDRIAETVRRNPLSVIMLEDIDEADLLVKGSIKRAMERGRLADAHGREISLGNVIFILTTNWLPDNLKLTSHGNVLDDKKLASLASRGWQLRLSLSERSAKRRASWLHDEEDSRMMKPRKETCSSGLSFDLNETADVDEDKGDGSHNSSDLTVDHEEERERCYCPTDNKLLSSSSHDLLSSVDDAIAFKPVDFGPIKRELANAVARRFSAIVGDRLPIEIPDEALEKITSGVWIGQTGMEEWIEKVLVPSFHELKPKLGCMSDDSLVARLEIVAESDDGCGGGEWLPESIKVLAVDGF